MNRRETFKFMLGAAALASSARIVGINAAKAEEKAAFTLPPLGYPFDALEPNIDTMTMQIHHDNHHGGYVKNLNSIAEKWPDLAKKPIEDILSIFPSCRTNFAPPFATIWAATGTTLTSGI